jgi:hypothetical protein
MRPTRSALRGRFPDAQRTTGRLLLPPAVLILAGIALGGVATPGIAQRYVATGDTLHPRIRYADSLESANDRCMVSKQKLNLRVRPVYVNGVPMGFC